MTQPDAALFYLGSHNEVDQISPVLHKLGERRNIDVDVVLENNVSPTDYRIESVNKHKNVTLLNRDHSNPQLSARDRIYELMKDINKKIFNRKLKKLYSFYNKITQKQKYEREELPDKNHGLVGFDWSHSVPMSHLHDRDDVTTVVFPHGDDPFVNKLVSRSAFDDFVDEDSNFEHHTDRDNFLLHLGNEHAKHDYQLFANELTASRMPDCVSPGQVKIYGSPRYNDEWLEILSQIRPAESIDSDGDLNVVFFLRREGFFVSKSQVKNTLEILDRFDDLSVIVKEHPRARLLASTTADEMKNISIVKDEVSSASLVEWGDIFLSLGTSITFEPVVRRKPVLSIEYAHANRTVVSRYFPDADIRCFDDLYHTIHELLATGTNNFYDDTSHRAFTEEIITSGHKPVLDTWAEFIESKV